MTTNIKSITIILLAAMFTFTACKKTEYAFGTLKTPTNLSITAAIAGTGANSPNGDGSGTVVITTTATDAITYKIDFGDGTSKLVPSGSVTYKYSNPGTTDFTITINAIGTGGVISTISKKITVFVAFVIPPEIVAALTNNASRTWVTDKDAPGHVGVGANSVFTPNYYSADPNTRAACLYDDEIAFTEDANGNIFINVDNKGQSFLIGASTSFYGVNGGDNCYDINTSGVRKLSFMNATSTSTPDISTRIQFMVPGNGIINFATGGNTYEILSASATNISLRNIGIDGNAWYQKLKAK
jgi:hypothetical protein